MNNCTNCIHSRVCGNKSQFKSYTEEFEELSKKWDLFTPTPPCPEWHDIKLLEIKRENTYLDLKNKLERTPTVTYGDLKARERISQTFENAEKEVCPSKDTYDYDSYGGSDALFNLFSDVLGLKARDGKVGTNPSPKSKKPRFDDDTFF